MNCLHRNKIAFLVAFLILILSTSVLAQPITIKASASPKAGGSISPSGKFMVDAGENLLFNITPNIEYQVKDVIVDGVSQGAVNTYTLTNITQKHSIKAKFTKKTFSVMIAEGGKVHVSPVGTRTVKYGKKIRLKMVPNSDDVVPILLVNGRQVDTTRSGKIYKFELTVLGDTSVYATSAIEPSLAPSVRIMDETTAQNLESISPDGSVLTFNGSTPYLLSLQPDDVMMSGVTDTTPYGLLRKVTNVTIDGPQVTVETTEATLEDAIEEGEIIINERLTQGNIVSFVPLIEGVTLRQGKTLGPVQAQACLSLSNVFYDYNGFQIGLNGEACLEPKFNLALGIEIESSWGIPYPVLKNLLFSVEISESIALELYANYTYSFSEKVPIATIVFGAITAGPVVFVPVLTLYVGIEGRLSAGITTGVTLIAGLTAGLTYSNGDWSPITDSTSSYDFSLPTLSVGAQAKVYAEPQFDLLVYGMAGPYARMQGYFSLEMDPLNDPWLSLYGGLEAGAGVTVKVFGKTLADFELPKLLDYRKLLAQLPGNKRPTITSLTANAGVVGTGRTSTVTVVASDPESDPLTCSWSSSGGTLSSATGCGSVTWTAPGISGKYTVLVSVKDDNPRHNPVTREVTITVQNQPGPWTSASFSGPWLFSSRSERDAHLISDGGGSISDCGIFNFKSGTYQVGEDGSFSATLKTEEDSSIKLSGHFTSGTTISIQSPSGTMTKISDASACSGTWSGTFKEKDGPSTAITFKVNDYGAVTSFTGISGPVTGRMFCQAKKVAAFFETGVDSEDPYSQIGLEGTKESRRITGSLYLNDSSGVDGTFTINKQ